MLGLDQATLSALIAATITGVVSLLGLIVSKEQKISDFRQAWIDALRSEIAAVITHAQSLHGLSIAELTELPDLWKSSREDFVKINNAIMLIKLRLNPDEVESKAILEKLCELELVLVSFPISLTTLTSIENSIIIHTRNLLKREWVRVKQGELVYKVARVLAAFVMVSGFLILFFSYARNPLPL
jgi:hypothetical protein